MFFLKFHHCGHPIKGLTKNMKKCSLNFDLWWIKRAVTVHSCMPMAFRYSVFFVKMINYSVEHILLPKVNRTSLIDVLSNLAFWTLGLELTLNIRPKWFNMSFKAIHAKVKTCC